MGIQQQPVRQTREEYHCDKCEVPVVYSGLVLTSMPPWYVHQCPSCKDEIKLRAIYPRLVELPTAPKPFERVGDEDDGYQD